jgi:hypothetical protein
MKTTRFFSLLIALMAIGFMAQAKTTNGLRATAPAHSAAVTDHFQLRLPPPPPRPRLGGLRGPHLAPPPPPGRIFGRRSHRRVVYRHRRVYRRRY